MKILVLFSQHHFTGPAEPELKKLSALRDHGLQITFCFTRKPPGTLAEKIASSGFNTLEEVQLYRKRPAPFSTWRDIRHLARFCESWQPDIVHCHLSHDHWTGMGVVRKMESGPVLIRSIHESRKLELSSGDKVLHDRTDGFIVPSIKFAQKLAASFSLDPAHVEVIRGVVDTERFRPGLDTTAVFREVGAQMDAPLIGIVSRIKAGRGHSTLIEAFRLVMDKNPTARLLIVGRGEGMERLVAGNADLVKSGHLNFLGFRTDDLPNILNALRVKVLLGEGSDGSCRAVLEAMACETPVIAAEIGLLPETVENGRTGLLVRPDDVDFLVAALQSVLEHPSRMADMGRVARQVILERHTIKHAVAAQQSFYQRMIEKRHQP